MGCNNYINALVLVLLMRKEWSKGWEQYMHAHDIISNQKIARASLIFNGTYTPKLAVPIHFK
jgi:hypothetical protein